MSAEKLKQLDALLEFMDKMYESNYKKVVDHKAIQDLLNKKLVYYEGGNRLYLTKELGKKEHLSFKGKEVCLWLDEKRSCDVHQGIPDDKMPLVLAHHIEQFHKHGRLEFYDGCPCGGCT